MQIAPSLHRLGSGIVASYLVADPTGVTIIDGEIGPRPAPFTLVPVGALSSLGRLEALDARWVLPGHGEPWDGGVAEAVRSVLAAAAAG